MENLTDIDRIIHLGDFVSDAKDLESIYTGIPIDYVKGNCDYFESSTPREKILNLSGKRILLTHGHYYNVKDDYYTIGQVGMERAVELVLFGHTHRAYLGYEKDVMLLNPGSISEPRGSGKPSYAIIEIDKNDKLHGSLYQLKKVK